MANTINAITTGIGGLATTADSSGDISLQSAGSTVVAVTSGGVAVTGTMTVGGNAVLNAGTPVTVSQGGTGLTTYTQGDLVYASATNTLGRLADVATGNALISGGVGADPSWGKIGLTTHVDGTLPVANGGTGATSLTANNVILGNGTSAVQFVAPSTNGNVLTSNGTTWVSSAPPAGGVTSLNGQSGAITNTGFGDIGSYVVASSNAFAMNTRYNGGETFAGSSLDRDNQNAGATNTIGSLSGTAGSSPWAVTAPTNTGLASMGLSGTWRVMCGIQNGNISNINRRALALFVRIS